MSQIDIIDELKGIAQYLGDNGMTTCLRVVNRAIKEIQDGRDYMVEEVNRINTERQKTLNAGAVWEGVYREAEQENAKLREKYRNASESYGGLCRTLDDSGKRNTELENVIREMAIEVEQAGPSGMYSMWIKRWPFIERLLKEGGDE